MHRRAASTLLLVAAACARAGGDRAAPAPAAQPAQATPAVAAPSSPAPAPARLVTPEAIRFAPRITANGTLKARQAAPLAMAVPGTLARIAVKRGQAVRQGALLLALDDRLAQATRRQAEAGVAKARAELALAEDALDRVERIRREEGASESQLITARAHRDLARAGVAAAEAQLEQARVNLSYQQLTAPFPGVVTRLPDGVGLTVGAGTPLLQLATTRTLVLETSLTQEEAAEVRPGDPVTVAVQASGARTEDAVITVVLPAVEAGTNRVPVEVEVPNPDGRFLVNAYARAELRRGAERGAWRVPAAALVQRGGGYAVWVAAADTRARTLPVRLLAEEGAAAIVQPAAGEGWPDGVRVIELPPVGLVEGAALAEVRG
ncbi:MAG TPA: efflux RND transporter periplasmic adaptor subunit [Anaeromyxobacter sp.]|nr:efflux RND transporter periplasmic adaptor subunit [Anaeromyxobacter sp.]